MFNVGYLMGLNLAGVAGGAISLVHVDAPSHSVGRGIHPSAASLPLYSPSNPTSALFRPSAKFDARGIAVVEFLWDAASIPATVASRTGITATRCRYEAKVGASARTSA